MTLRKGDWVPDIDLVHMGASGPEPISRDALFGGRNVVVFAVPGAFTPTCSAQHLPSFLECHDRIVAQGIDQVACVSVNDVFVMHAWGQAKDPDGRVLMLADGIGQWTRAAGLDWDLSSLGLGVRSQRYAMIVRDAVVRFIAVEQGGAFEASSGQAILAALQAQ